MMNHKKNIEHSLLREYIIKRYNNELKIRYILRSLTNIIKNNSFKEKLNEKVNKLK